MEEFEKNRITKKIDKLIKNYKVLEESNVRLKVENKYLDDEIKKLKKRVSELSGFELKQKKVVSKIKRVLNKLNSLNQGL